MTASSIHDSRENRAFSCRLGATRNRWRVSPAEGMLSGTEEDT
jgi:hypothetical protein